MASAFLPNRSDNPSTSSRTRGSALVETVSARSEKSVVPYPTASSDREGPFETTGLDASWISTPSEANNAPMAKVRFIG